MDRGVHKGRPVLGAASGRGPGNPPSVVLVRVDHVTGKVISSVPLLLPEGYNPLVSDLTVYPGGRRIAISTAKFASDVHLIEGFAQPETGWRRLLRYWKVPERTQ